MPKQYCPTCGATNEYSVTLPAPKFCGQCSKSLSVASVSVTTAPAYSAAPRDIIAVPPRRLLKAYGRDDDDEDEDDGPVNIRVPRKLDIEFEVDVQERPKLGSIMQGSQSSVSIDKGGKRLSQKARKERLTEWRGKLQTMQRHDIGGAGE